MLMMLVGFTVPTSGEIWIGGREITHVQPHRRNIGIVFQNFALFPHMTVAENIAFPMRMRRYREADIRVKIGQALDLVRLPGLEHRFPAQLSGGQQQRVALARALVFDPGLLLLDEPLGALDKKLREEMQVEIKSLHARLGTTMVHVTHDQVEALALSDRVAVLRDGRIEQVGSPRELYERPTNRFVADFVGESNFLVGRIDAVDGAACRIVTRDGIACVASRTADLSQGREVEMMIRPERIAMGYEAASYPNRFPGHIVSATYVGDAWKVRVALGPETELLVSVQNRGDLTAVEVGTKVVVGWKASDALVFERVAGERAVDRKATP
jgi:putative spermidine/putrescine transport system ATP-binding protein